MNIKNLPALIAAPATPANFVALIAVVFPGSIIDKSGLRVTISNERGLVAAVSFMATQIVIILHPHIESHQDQEHIPYPCTCGQVMADMCAMIKKQRAEALEMLRASEWLEPYAAILAARMGVET